MFAAICWGIPSNALAKDQFTWRASANRADADISTWNLHQLLQQITTQTGWEVYVEPGTDRAVSVKFRDLEMREALGRLLGDLNFALLPQPLGAAKLFIYRTSVQEATKLVPPLEEKDRIAEKKGKIPDELIVKLKPGSKITIDELAKQLGAKVVGRADGLNAYRLKFDSESAATDARQSLSSNNDVASTDSNYNLDQPTRVKNSDVNFGSLNVKAKAGNDPNQIIIGLIDTPVQSQQSNLKDFLLKGISVAGEATTSSDSPTHGTAMAEAMLQGIAAANQSGNGISTRILPVDVYGNNANTTSFDVANGIYKAINDGGADIINLSLGGTSDSEFLHQVITPAHDKNISFVASAGNEPTTDAVYPAAYSEVTAVTAGDRQGNIASYANRSDYVKVVAPGSSVVDYNGQSYSVTGTSVSSAYTTGLIAGVAEANKKSVADATQKVQSLLPVKKP